MFRTFSCTSSYQPVQLLGHFRKTANHHSSSSGQKLQGNSCLSLMNNSFQDAFDHGTSCIFSVSCLSSEWLENRCCSMVPGTLTHSLQTHIDPPIMQDHHQWIDISGIIDVYIMIPAMIMHILAK